MENTILKIPHNKCTGCGACANACPKNAITMELDAEGFLFPKVNEELCIDCGKCRKVCPVEHPVSHHPTPKSYAVWAKDSVRKESSSGGMFTLMADWVLEQGGVVFGARYAPDYQSVYHAAARNQEELLPLKKSKYVQSDTGLTYREAKKALDGGQYVLYTGCPCQIAGLYNYLGKDYDKLITADLVCHGANSTTAYQSFLKEFSEGKPIEKVDFRDKVYYNWSTPTVVYLKNGEVIKTSWDKGTWYKGFLGGYINRENCYSCPYANAERIADITLADAWQVHRLSLSLDDRKGTSLVLVNSSKGKDFFRKLENAMTLCKEVPLEELRKYNGQLNKPTARPHSRSIFFAQLPQKGYHEALKYATGGRFHVALVGWWFASNYGSTLTYYALGSILRERGLQPLLVPIPKLDGYPWESATKQSVDFLAKHFVVGKNRPVERMHEFNAFCDSFMLGSDQLWTAETIRQLGYTFFLDFVDKNKKKIAFSTSFGHTDFAADTKMLSTARDYLTRFDAISVREESGVELCKKIFGLEAQHILDPVFLCKRADYDRLTDNIVPKIDISEKYLLCYILDPTLEKEAIAHEIAKRQGLKIITMLGLKEYDHAKANWSTGELLPKVTSEEFLYYIKNCSYLLTDSHHGTCFGIIYHKQYTAMINTGRGATRFESVANALGLKDRLLYPEESLSGEKVAAPIDYQAVEARLEQEKQKAADWLSHAMSMPVKQGRDTAFTLAADNERKNCALYSEIRRLRLQVEQLAHRVRQLEEVQNPKEPEKKKKPWVAAFAKFRRSLKENGVKNTCRLCVRKLKQKFQK